MPQDDSLLRSALSFYRLQAAWMLRMASPAYAAPVGPGQLPPQPELPLPTPAPMTFRLLPVCAPSLSVCLCVCVCVCACVRARGRLCLCACLCAHVYGLFMPECYA